MAKITNRSTPRQTVPTRLVGSPQPISDDRVMRQVGAETKDIFLGPGEEYIIATTTSLYNDYDAFDLSVQYQHDTKRANVPYDQIPEFAAPRIERTVITVEPGDLAAGIYTSNVPIVNLLHEIPIFDPNNDVFPQNCLRICPITWIGPIEVYSIEGDRDANFFLNSNRLISINSSTDDALVAAIQQADDKVTAFNTSGGAAVNKWGLACGDDGFVYAFYCGPWSP